MQDKIREAYDTFRLDDETRREELDSLLAAVKTEQAAAPKKLKRRYRRAVYAACAVLVLAFGTLAYAEGWFGLKDLSMGRQDFVYKSTEESTEGGTEKAAAETTKSVIPDHPVAFEPISLVGPKGTPEYEAMKEWFDFDRAYSAEHMEEMREDEINGIDRTMEGYYGVYGCRSNEMAEKLDEILKKYSLRPHEDQAVDTYSITGLCEAAGIGQIFTANTELMDGRGYWGYYHDDGSFHFEGNWMSEDDETVSFQLLRNVYGSFNTGYLNVGDTDSVSEWEYTTSEGVHITVHERRKATIGLGEHFGEPLHPFLIATIERPESFVAVSIIRPLPSEETVKELLEDLHAENIP